MSDTSAEVQQPPQENVEEQQPQETVEATEETVAAAVEEEAAAPAEEAAAPQEEEQEEQKEEQVVEVQKEEVEEEPEMVEVIEVQQPQQQEEPAKVQSMDNEPVKADSTTEPVAQQQVGSPDKTPVDEHEHAAGAQDVPTVAQSHDSTVYKTPYYDKSDKFYTPFVKPIFHTLYLLEKNFLLHVYNWKVTLAQLLAPFVIVSLLAILSLVVESAATKQVTHPPEVAVDLTTINKCKPYVSDTCYTLMWAHNNNNFGDSVMKEIVSHYSLKNTDYKVFNYERDMLDYIAANENRTLTAVSFSNYTAGFGVAPMPIRSATTTRYDLYFNATTPNPTIKSDHVSEYFQHKAIIDNFILWVTNGKPAGEQLEMKIDYKTFPTFPQPRSGQSLIFGSTGPQFFCLTAMISLIVAMHQLVVEKEQRLRFGMNMMGLSTVAYWISWGITFVIMAALSSLITVLSGYLYQVFVFLRSDFISLWWIFFVFQVCIICLAFMLSTFVNNGKAALIFGFIILAATFILNQFLSVQDFIYIMYSKNCIDVDPKKDFCIDSWVIAIRFMLYIYPPFNFGKYFSDALAITNPVFNAEKNVFENSEKMFTLKTAFETFDSTGTFNVKDLPAPMESVAWLFLDSILFLVLGVYFDAILPKPSGTREHPLFFLFPSWWGINLNRNKEKSDEALRYHYIRKADDVAALDEDQRIEYNKVRDPEHPAAIRIFNLKRDFVTNMGLPFISKTVSAVDGLDLQVEKGTCLGLLGHNGAGKTTTISMLIGLIAPTYGDITVNGVSVRENLEGVRRQLGVCPQHDILWGELTPWQHLKLFARLRGLPLKYVKREIIERLKAVNLYDVRNKQVRTFSGGMKRRLTVAISLIGSPPVILLDEPTTGLDPKSRTSVWELIHSMKGECVIILTTHSMAEADTLSDRIAIMADGKLRCVGNSLELKAKYGAGYNLTIVSNEGRDNDLKAFVKERLPQAVLFREDAGSIIYNVLPEYLKQIGTFLKIIETVTKANIAKLNKAEGEEEKVDLSEVGVDEATFQRLRSIIKDWEISYTTLEQVFHASLPSHGGEEED